MILGGIAYPSLINNVTVQVPLITLYGMTSDGTSFLIQEAGVGSPNRQISRIV